MEHLCQKTGVMRGEAVGLLVAKATVLVLVVVALWGVTVEVLPDGITDYVIALALLALPLAGMVALGLLLFTDLVVGRLRGARRFRRPSRAQHRAARAAAPAAAAASPVPAPAPPLPEDALAELAPLGPLFFGRDMVGPTTLIVGLSALSLGFGIALLVLMAPLVHRRGDDALDLAVTDAGLVVRGGSLIRWEELDEILVVRDRRMSGLVEPRKDRVAPMSRTVVNLTWFPHHSRTRLALVPWDMPAVAQRALSSRAPQRALRVQRDLRDGYLLCDLWTHSPEAVEQVIARLRARTSRLGVRLPEVERGAWLDRSWGASETFRALTGRG